MMQHGEAFLSEVPADGSCVVYTAPLVHPLVVSLQEPFMSLPSAHEFPMSGLYPGQVDAAVTPISHCWEHDLPQRSSGMVMVMPSETLYGYADGLSLSEASVCSSPMGLQTPDLFPSADAATMPDRMMISSTHRINATCDGPPAYNQSETMMAPLDEQLGNVVPPNPLKAPYAYSHSTDSSIISSPAMPGRSSSLPSHLTLMDNDLFEGDIRFISSECAQEQQVISGYQSDQSASTDSVAGDTWKRTNDADQCDIEKATMPLYGSLLSARPRKTKTEAVKRYRHLSRQQLIERVVQLEAEKRAAHIHRSVEHGLNDPTVSTGQVVPHECQWKDCRAEFPAVDDLIRHIRETHIGSGKPVYYCEWKDCPRHDKPFMKRHKMQNHMRTHTGERPFVCTFSGCAKRFSRPDSLNTHIKIHSNIRPYICPFGNCSKAYFHSRSLRKHTRTHHHPRANSDVSHSQHYLSNLSMPSMFPSAASSDVLDTSSSSSSSSSIMPHETTFSVG